MLGLFASKPKVIPAPPSRPLAPPPSPVVAPVELAEQVVASPAPLPLAGMMSRQPIVEATSTLHGYALLTDDGAAYDDVTAQQQVEHYSFLIPESEKIRAFLPATRELLEQAAEKLPRNAVIEIGDAVQLDEDLMTTCRQLRKRGYRLLVDGAIPSETRKPLMEFADYLTIDFETADEDARKALYGDAIAGQTTLVARRVDSTETQQRAQKEGCKLFQGGFLAQPFVPPPGLKASKSIPDNQLICLRLMAALSEETINLGSIEKLIMMDTALVYRLLRLVNSALYSLNSRITSIRSALVIVGTDEFRKLISMTLASIFANTNSYVMVTLAVERARFCEMLAPQLREPGPKLYLMGMLTMVDVILKMPMAKVLATLPLEGDMTSALLGEPGVITDALDLSRAYQAGDWKTCTMLQQQLRVDDGWAAQMFLQSARWADKVSSGGL